MGTSSFILCNWEELCLVGSKSVPTKNLFCLDNSISRSINPCEILVIVCCLVVVLVKFMGKFLFWEEIEFCVFFFPGKVWIGKISIKQWRSSWTHCVSVSNPSFNNEFLKAVSYLTLSWWWNWRTFYKHIFKGTGNF